MKVASFELEDWERQMFNKLSGEHDLLLTDERLNTQVQEDFLDVDAISANIGNLNIPR